MARFRSTTAVLCLLALAIAACSGGSTPTPSPKPSPGPALTTTELKLELIDRFGPLWFCDPDVYPIAIEDEAARAAERWPEIEADAQVFAALVGHLGLDPTADLDDAERLEVYRLWKMTNAIALEPIGQDAFRFVYLAQPPAGAAEGTRRAGTIAVDGTIAIEQEAAAGEPICPICLARGTLIDTPAGPIPVERIRIGDIVWSLDASGRPIEVHVLAIGSAVAPAAHRVVRLVLADGGTVTASPGHPLADGRRLGAIRAGDLIDGTIVVRAEHVAYGDGRTFDIAVGGPTGVYLSGGIALGSTLTP